MFDDLTPKNNEPVQPANVPTPPGAPSSIPEDMFAASEPEKPAQFQPKPASNFQMPEMAAGTSSGDMAKRLIVIALIVVGLGMVGFGGYYAYVNYYLADGSAPIVETENTPADNATVQEAVQNNGENPAAGGLEVVTPDLDTDQDGLSDAEEESLGINKTETDSDFDGLFDREEVKVYLTNPNNPDTDADGVKDGEEVENKTNPKGDGALYGLDGQASSTPSSEDGGEGSIPSQASTSESVATGTGETAVPASEKIDSDNDGLTDSEEIDVYKTDPKKADTDGDSYLDGVEVRGGYNPNGPGMLK